MSFARTLQDHGARLITRRLPGARLAIQSGGCGFFGDVFMALNGIRFAELNGLACEVAWGRRSLYFEPGAEENVWSHFFLDSRYDFVAGASRPRPIPAPYRPGAHDFIAYPGLTVRRSVAQAIARFCRVRPKILAEVEGFAASRFRPQGMVGVHVRLTDAARGHESRRSVGLDHFLAATEQALERYADAGVFLATDDAGVVDRFGAAFGDRVVMRDCIRSTDGASLHGHYDAGVAGSALQKGEEVMVDALLLSRCRHIVRSHSRVTCFSLCVDPTLPFTDLDRIHLGLERTPWLHV